jgi:hypothetical protein
LLTQLPTFGAIAALTLSFAGNAQAQSTQRQPRTTESTVSPDDEADEGDIVVVGHRDPNAVIGDIPPENRMTPRDIRAYGASNIADLLQAISPQTESGRGRDGNAAPVVLLNGKRISSFREIRDLPTEAILRLEILPEEVALKYGYRADQRIVNIVLRPRFRSTAVRAQGSTPTEGGRIAGQGDVTRVLIGDKGRTTLNTHAEDTTSLKESERDIAFTPATPGVVDPRPFRTLQASSRLARIGATYNTTLFGDVSSTFDGQIQWSDGHSLLGPSVTHPNEPLHRSTNSPSGHLGLALNGQKKEWRWSLTGTYDLTQTETQTERESILSGFSEDFSRSISQTGQLDLMLNGPLSRLPAGPVNMTVRLGADSENLDSRSSRGGLRTSGDLSRRQLSSSFNLDVPIAKRNGAWSPLGNLSFNANAEVDQLSDFGTLTVLGAGLYWSPIAKVNLIASWTREGGPPDLRDLGNPLLVTPNSRVFDFVTGQTVLVQSITGGNPDLESDRRRIWKLGGTFKPLTKTDLTLRADYIRTRIADPVSRFAGPTPALEAAFPSRFQRDAAGNLISVDLRPVNYASSATDQLRWGFIFSKPLRSARPSQSVLDRLRALRQQQGGGTQGGQGGQRGPGGGGGGFRGGGGYGGGGFRGGGRGGGGRFGGGQGGRLQLSVFHTILFKDQVRIGPGLPAVDYLNGEAQNGTVTPRHKIETDAGWYNNGFGVQLSGTWQSGGKIIGGDRGTLDFSPLAKVNFNIFANLGDRIEWTLKHPWMRGLQIRMGVDNIFDAKQKVRDAAGGVSINYQPDLLDPVGRVVSISIRKLFSPRPVFRGRGGPSGR